jgi:hypothetical protein
LDDNGADDLDVPLLGALGRDGDGRDDDGRDDDGSDDGSDDRAEMEDEDAGSARSGHLYEDGVPRGRALRARRAPGIQQRLLAKYTGTLAGFVLVATSLAAKSLLAYPMLIYALVVITSPPTHGRGSASLPDTY